MLARDLAGELGKQKKKKKKGKKESGGKQPQGQRKILYACALKHKVCGQLLKDFFLESQDYPQTRAGVGWGMIIPVQLNSTGVTERHCQLSSVILFFKFSQTCIPKNLLAEQFSNNLYT